MLFVVGTVLRSRMICQTQRGWKCVGVFEQRGGFVERRFWNARDFGEKAFSTGPGALLSDSCATKDRYQCPNTPLSHFFMHYRGAPDRGAYGPGAYGLRSRNGGESCVRE